MSLVEDGFFLDVNIEGGRFAFHQPDKVAHLAFQGNIGDQTMAGFCIEAGQVAGIWVAIGVAIAHIENKYKIIAVIEVHLDSP